MAVYEVELADGSVYEVETDDSTPAQIPLEKGEERDGSLWATLGKAALNTVGGMLPGVSTVQAIAKDPVGVGMIAGGLAVGPPGVMGGAMLGSMAEQGKQFLTGSPDAPKRLPEFMNRTTETGVTALASEALGPLAKGVVKGAAAVGKPLSKVAQALTGVESQNILRAAKDPAALLPPGLGGPPTLRKAGEAIETALDKAGIVDESNPFPDHQSVAREAWARVKAYLLGNGEKPTAQELFNWKRSVDDVMDKTSWSRRSGKSWRDTVLFKSYLRDELGKLSGELADASKQYARSALRSEFLSPIPVNQSGTPSIMRSGLAPAIARMFGLPAVAGTIAASPMIVGPTVAAGAASKVLTSDTGRRAVTSGISEILRRNKERKNGGRKQ